MNRNVWLYSASPKDLIARRAELLDAELWDREDMIAYESAILAIDAEIRLRNSWSE